MSCYTIPRGLAPVIVLALALAGCGGSSSSTPPAMKAGGATASFQVDVGTGRVTVTPMNGEASKRAVMNGRVITFSSSNLTVQDAALETNVLNVRLTNHLNKPIGDKYVRVVLSNLRSEPAAGPPVKVYGAFASYGTSGGTKPHFDYPLAAGPLASNATTAAVPWVFIVPAGTLRFSFVATAEAATTSPTPPLGVANGTHPQAHAQTVILTSTNPPTHSASQLNGPAGAATLNQRTVGIDVASDGAVFLSSYRTVRRYDPRTGRISTIAGDSAIPGEVAGSDVAGPDARFKQISSVAVVRPDLVYVSDWAAAKVYLLRQIGADPAAASSWTVSHILGHGAYGDPDGTSTSPLRSTYGLAAAGERTLWFCDEIGHVCRAFSAGGNITHSANWVVSIVAGGGGDGSTDAPSKFRSPWDIVATSSTDAIVADRGNHKIRRVNAAGVVSTLAGPPAPTTAAGYVDGAAAVARFEMPGGIARDEAGNLYTADRNGLRRISPAGEVTTITQLRDPVSDGVGMDASVGGFGAARTILGLSVAPDGDIWLVDDVGLRRISRMLISTTG
mgnify:CR=1 FL=1